MVVRLCVPLIHVFRARNWNLARSGCCPTALIVASRFGVSTPLRGGLAWVVAVTDMSRFLLCQPSGEDVVRCRSPFYKPLLPSTFPRRVQRGRCREVSGKPLGAISRREFSFSVPPLRPVSGARPRERGNAPR